MVTDGSCTQECKTGYSDNNSGNGQVYTCPAGVFTGTLLTCSPNPCNATVPTGPGYNTSCSDLVTDATCTHECTAGYSDNNGGNGQDYTCPGGVFAGTLLTCTPKACTATVPTGDGFGDELAAAISHNMATPGATRTSAADNAQSRHGCIAVGTEAVKAVDVDRILRGVPSGHALLGRLHAGSGDQESPGEPCCVGPAPAACAGGRKCFVGCGCCRSIPNDGNGSFGARSVCPRDMWFSKLAP